ncbi:NAD(P)H-dependent oxidoreductase subunit E [Hydrogenovibrio sp. JE_KL2]|uniref:NADH-quinone oxidoreductase subunit NuoE family protein n=1 Tax=Hydrogenovibrio sp. JE_KL2 TaxID=2651188 RepID=UPI00128BB907|nr:NAD(P)H-dependent oxidoreductase subunit E [Hydrogenovibrio sp. JE_KL2]MBN2607312.1 NAD(P)H-dependent oxidoreductase subunit E [Thiotrichales bacterium]MPQ77009.1 NAD(P)H-dependent oxidoreductase subunit E [Hydrogenovibrio sp. JE_KL2]
MSATANVIQGEVKERIDRWVSHYPEDQKQSAVMPALRIVQEVSGGSLTTELMDQVADYLEMTPIAVYEVATFYSMYEHKPVGRHKICLCTNISCMLRGSDEILEHLEKKLGVGVGEVTPDGKFSIKKVECLGACGGAPMMMLGKEYYENLTEESLDEILDGLE